MRTLLSLLLCFLFSASCGDQDKMDYIVSIHTDLGDIRVILYDATARHKENFLKLAREKSYDGSIFHRVIPRFMIQGGDLTRKPGNTLSETTLPAEFSKDYFHRKGALAAARQGDQVNPEKKSSSFQFYIVQGDRITDPRLLTVDRQLLEANMGTFLLKPENKVLLEKLNSMSQANTADAYMDYLYSLIPQVEKALKVKILKDIPQERLKSYEKVDGAPHLDDNYTVFGQVVEGLEVVDKIAAVATHPDNRPKEDIKISMTVEEISANELRKRYGLDEKMRLP